MSELIYKSPDWRNTSKRELTYDDAGTPILTITDYADGGSKKVLTGLDALTNARSEDTGKNSIYTGKVYHGPDDYRESWTYGLGASLRKALTPDPNNHFGVFAGPAIWGGGGYLLGKLLEMSTGRKYLGIGGAIGGGALGLIRAMMQDKAKKRQDEATQKQASVPIEKSAMYADPRNYILERLQGATDISPFEKAQLAAQIRQMSWDEANRLKSQVRAAVGFGVGALIARFVGHRGVVGTLLGGAVGALVGKLLPHGNRPPVGIFSGNFY